MLHDSHRVSVENVPCYRYRKGVEVEIPGQGTVSGDIAWGGNWFFLVSNHNQSLELDLINELTEYCTQIRRQLDTNNITGSAYITGESTLLFDARDPFVAGINI